jgi:PIN domain nuclease of toxin-antitoxin system
MLLLDSQVLLWVVDDNPRLGRRARHAITTAGGVYVSSATVLELTIKSMLGKIDVPHDIADVMVDQGFVELPVTHEHAQRVRDFGSLVRHDPFDRILVSQATCNGLDLLTADRVLLDLGRRHILDATR